ncbi:MAG: hypothetical protein EOO24_56915 [Comamonadaceae bacterium]|nr:MAG: hypothetical protein EOO24_56915 [Comamonadaceae bacterium]
MDFRVSVHPGTAFVLVVCSGNARWREVLEAIDAIGESAVREGASRAVLDVLAVDLQASTEEHAAIGQRLAVALGELERVAFVVDQGQRVGVGEDAARQGGLNLKTFVRLPEAIDWVTASGEQTA